MSVASALQPSNTPALCHDGAARDVTFDQFSSCLDSPNYRAVS
ncbi:MAG TPA: hypothetical protein VIM73_02510 [Polyangiaceae bacterium]